MPKNFSLLYAALPKETREYIEEKASTIQKDIDAALSFQKSAASRDVFDNGSGKILPCQRAPFFQKPNYYECLSEDMDSISSKLPSLSAPVPPLMTPGSAAK